MQKLKYFSIILATLLCILLPGGQVRSETLPGNITTVTLSPGNPEITVQNNQTSESLLLETAPFSPDGVTLIPVRGVLEALGASIEYQPETRQVEINEGLNNVTLTLDSANAAVNGIAVKLDKPAQAVNDRTMIPLRFISENMGYSVKWYGDDNKIVITKSIIMTVNGTPLSLSDYEKETALSKYFMEKNYGPNIWSQQYENGVTYKTKFPELVKDMMIQHEITYQKALSLKRQPGDNEINTAADTYQKLAQSDPVFAAIIKDNGIGTIYLRKKVEKDIAFADYQEDFEKSLNISETEMKAVYKQNSNSFRDEQVQAAHILIKTLDESNPDNKAANEKAYRTAGDILKRVQAGEDFSTLARNYSEDTGSGPQGGELGYFSKGVMVKEFEDAAFSLSKGQISGLVKTQYGYHIIKAEDHIFKPLSYDQVKAYIKTILSKSKLQDNLETLAKAASIQLYTNP